MCWKQEWASAINNINWTIIHIERAQAKLQKRLARNEQHLEYQMRQKGYKDKQALAEIQGLIQKNRKAFNDCKALIDVLRGHQKMLENMIAQYGINRQSESARLKQLMDGNRTVKGKPWTDKPDKHLEKKFAYPMKFNTPENVEVLTLTGIDPSWPTFILDKPIKLEKDVMYMVSADDKTATFVEVLGYEADGTTVILGRKWTRGRKLP